MGVDRANVIEHVGLPEERSEFVNELECHSPMFVSSGSGDEVSSLTGSDTDTTDSFVDSPDLVTFRYLRKTWLIEGAIDGYMHNRPVQH